MSNTGTKQFEPLRGYIHTAYDSFIASVVHMRGEQRNEAAASRVGVGEAPPSAQMSGVTVECVGAARGQGGVGGMSDG